MRRAISTILFVIGGFCVGMQVMIGFMAGGGPDDYVGRWAYFSAIAAGVLAIATWASPGQRWKELGLAILIGAAVCTVSFSVTIFLPDEEGAVMGTGELRPYLAIVPGFANLFAVGIGGAMLYLLGGSRSRA